MIDKKTVAAVILVAGNSTRYGKGINKNLDVIQNKPILSYSLKAFNDNKYIDDIILVARNEEIEVMNGIIEKQKITKPIKVVKGGKTRQESVYNAIIETNSDIAIIHDGARPMIKQKYIDECLESMSKYVGTTVGVKSKDTIKIANEDNEIIETTERKNTWIIQTPQCFDRRILLNMHEKYRDDDSITDDCMLLEKDNYKVKIISGDYSNIKITTSDDIFIVNELIKNNRNV